MNRTTVDVSCDLGESFGCYKLGLDEEVIGRISSVNVSCGFHAGDPHVMRRTVALANASGVRIGAHPGLPDLLGFGRRKMAMTPDEIYDFFLYQIGALKAFVEATGQRLQHVKLHGALFEMALEDAALTHAMCMATRAAGKNLIWLAPAGKVAEAGRDSGLRVAVEFYADRAYHPDRRLVSRKTAGAVLEDMAQIRERLLQALRTGCVTTIEGQTIPVEFDSICVHGDTRGALEIVQLVRSICAEQGVEVKPLSELVK